MMAEGGYARSGSTYSTLMDQAKAIVREKHPRQARYLDVLNIVMKPDMEGHSEYRSGDYDDSKEYGYKHTIEINPRYSKTPEEIASTIAGETLHHMRDKDPEFRQMWSGLRETLGQNPEFRKFQEKRQGTMKDTRDLDHFIDASALDEWIRAYQFKDDPIAGKHYEKNWKTDEFHKDKKYQPQFENIRQYLGKGMATGGVAAGPVGVVDQPSADNSGVADDVPAESDGYVINAAAVRKIGLRKINDMIQKAIKYAQEQGMQLDFGKTPTNAEEILVSNGEVVIPDVLARIIGYDELEKINALGAEETDEVIEEQGEKPVQEMPVALRKGGSSWKAYLDKYQGPFPDEDAQIRQTILDKMEPYEDSELEDLELYKKNYEDYWNPETALKQRGSNRRYLDEERTERGPEWGGYLDKAYTDFEASDEVKEAVRRVLPAFKYELDKHGMYDAKQFDYWSQIESKGGKDRISDDKNDYGTFQVNMPLLKKIFKSDELFENFTKYYGPKATAATGISPYFLRKLYLEDKESFKDLMVDDHATNLAVGLAGSLLPAVD